MRTREWNFRSGGAGIFFLLIDICMYTSVIEYDIFVGETDIYDLRDKKEYRESSSFYAVSRFSGFSAVGVYC